MGPVRTGSRNPGIAATTHSIETCAPLHVLPLGSLSPGARLGGTAFWHGSGDAKSGMGELNRPDSQPPKNNSPPHPSYAIPLSTYSPLLRSRQTTLNLGA